jgi:RNA polymerase sigma-70 factor (ECF subfamily)
MPERDRLARRFAEGFEEQRPHLRGVAYRMLGSLSDADDAVQEGWLRLSRAGDDDVENLRAWLTTVVARISRRRVAWSSRVLLTTRAGGRNS